MQQARLKIRSTAGIANVSYVCMRSGRTSCTGATDGAGAKNIFADENVVSDSSAEN